MQKKSANNQNYTQRLRQGGTGDMLPQVLFRTESVIDVEGGNRSVLP